MTTERIPTFCALCISRCGATGIVEDGALRRLEADPSHPTGKAVCVKGKAAPELVYHPERLRTPLRRTRPKSDGDPGWQPISWDEALDETAARLRALAAAHGPETVVFSAASPSTTAIADVADWIQRLRRAYGSPNLCASMELCGWGRFFATGYTFGAPVPGMYVPDLERAGCILYWGYNPSVARLAHATATVEALRRGAKLVVIDPRRVGLAHRADEWLRVRPGTDAALALALARVMIARGWYDADFVRRWTNGPLLVRDDTGRLLRDPAGRFVAWDTALGAAVPVDPAGPAIDSAALALDGEIVVPTADGPVACRPAFALVAAACARGAAVDCGVPAEQIERTARLLWEARPLAYYAWSGVEQHSDATQIARAIAQLCVLTGSLDVPGGNVLLTPVPSAPFAGAELLSPEQRRKALGLARRPLGPSRWEFVTSDDLYTAILDGTPYRVRGVVGFGANLLMAQPDTRRGRDALAALDFFVHADLFMTPTAQLADIVLPAASPFETESLAIGFEVSQEAQSLVQLRRPLVPPVGAARSDLRIVFDLAVRLGLGAHFWDGDIDAALRHRLAPSGVTLEALRAQPAGVRVPVETRHRKYAALVDGRPRGFDTPSRRIELFSETLAEHGHPPVPTAGGPARTPDARYPLVLTCSKGTFFCESQHRGLPSLRRRAPDPEVDLHPEAARARGITEGEWVQIETPGGRVRARARFDDSLDPGVVCGQHGWWQACAEIGAPGYDPFDEDGVNLNRVLRHEPSDPTSGSVPLRAYVCEIARIG